MVKFIYNIGEKMDEVIRLLQIANSFPEIAYHIVLICEEKNFISEIECIDLYAEDEEVVLDYLEEKINNYY